MNRIAIVGAGPRGVFAAGRLLAHAERLDESVAITVFDPAPPGHGAAYDPDQPEFLRLNVRSAIIDAGWHDGAAPSHDWLPSFDQWRRAGDETTPLDPFPPRAFVGRYLAEVWQLLLDHLPTGCELTHRGQRVDDLRGVASGWQIGNERYDEVLLTTGHATDWPGALRHDWSGTETLVPAVFPATRHLRTEAVPSASRVAVRGAALTFIDAALALTEGRGGWFVEQEGRLAYLPSGAEPSVIWPVARKGRWMETKPEPGSASERLDLTGFRDAGCQDIRAASGQADAVAVVRQVAHSYLDAAGGGDHDELDAVFDGEPTDDATATFRRSLEVATGREAPHGAWAVGRAWRDLYPALVERCSGLSNDFEAFAEVAGRLERVAFGPPPVNAAKMLALIDAGIIDPASLAEASIDSSGLHWPGHEADVVVDAVLPPPGVASGPATLPGVLVERGLLATPQGRRGLAIEPDGGCLDRWGRRLPGLSAAGRPTEDVVIGNDTLDQRLHSAIENWAMRVAEAPGAVRRLRSGVRGEPALSGRFEPWQVELLADAQCCVRLVEQHGSPVNVINPAPLVRNAAELVAAGADREVEVRVHFARKANKSLGLVEQALQAGHGVDVASRAELQQALEVGAPGERVLLTAAVKPDELLAEAADAGVIISLDSLDELGRVGSLAGLRGGPVSVMPRIAPPPQVGLRPTRFGELPLRWLAAMSDWPAGVRAVGVHVHLDGYRIADRVAALDACLPVVDALRAAGQPVEFVDLGGGIPMSYLDDGEQWRAFWEVLDAEPGPDELLWRDRRLDKVYPYHQSPVRGEWLAELLDSALPDGASVAEALRGRGLRLHLEPGRSLLDGCGLTLARVAFTKQRSDGVGLVGLEMNRTQLRTTSDDYLVDPLLVRTGRPGQPMSGFLVGAYCIEDELILLRRMEFPKGVTAGDLIALPNTAGYFMHILESASHQIPLARNVVLQADASFVLDAIDRG